MPEISRFYGISITMYSPDHNPPHFHAYYQDYEASVDFNGNVIKGHLPRKQEKLVSAWALLREAELRANWQLMESGEQVEKIEPLR